MTDLLLTEGADIALANGDLVLDTGLGSAVLRSLLTDRRATADELVRAGVTDPRGWWGENEGDAWGSGLWLLAREKQTAETQSRAREYARDALRWLITEGAAEAVEVEVTYPAPERLAVAVRLVRGKSTRWAQLWARPQPAYHASPPLTLSVVLEGSRR